MPTDHECHWSAPIALVWTGFLLLGIPLISLWTAPALVHQLVAKTGQPPTLELQFRTTGTLFGMLVIAALIFPLWVRPMFGLRMRMLLYTLLAESIVLCIVWIMDPIDRWFWTEASNLTFFSAVVLVLCATGAAVNLFAQRIWEPHNRLLHGLWAVFSAAFLLAAADEYFRIHERLGPYLKVAHGQDLITAGYAVGALGAVAAACWALRQGVFHWKNHLPRLLVAGVLALGSAMLLDTFDFVLAPWIGANASKYWCNSIEETLEFTAASLFCCATWVGVVEGKEGCILKLAKQMQPQLRPMRFAQAAYLLLCLCLLGGLAWLRIHYDRIDHVLLYQKDNYTIQVFADTDDGLDQPDGLTYNADYGLIVCNEGTGDLLVFDAEGNGKVFIEAQTGLSSPEDVAVYGEGFFVSDDANHRILNYPSPELRPVVVEATELLSPEGLALDAQNRLYVADEKLSLIYRLDGAIQTTIVSAEDGLKSPEEIVLDSAGNLYISDEAAHAIFRATPSGTVDAFATANDGLINPEGISLHQGWLYVTDSSTGSVFRFDMEGKVELLMCFSPKYQNLAGIAFDEMGRLYLVASNPDSKDATIFQVSLNSRSTGELKN
ncbi:NHL repeat-containing protein [Coraliomargarita parva]|uniref:NHL repeat-containing protein n=1 Tax=Coraliomargarita parva TaxID=3014050 RepID=UPI0022B49AAD|nr:NHL repeat-containing protein [Coraliomargarita parva]